MGPASWPSWGCWRRLQNFQRGLAFGFVGFRLSGGGWQTWPAVLGVDDPVVEVVLVPGGEGVEGQPLLLLGLALVLEAAEAVAEGA